MQIVNLNDGNSIIPRLYLLKRQRAPPKVPNSKVKDGTAKNDWIENWSQSPHNVNASAVASEVLSVQKNISSSFISEGDDHRFKMCKRIWSRKCVKWKGWPSTNYWLVICFIVLSVFCQVSEECPVSCECKWKSGKESVICLNPEAKLESIPAGLDPGTQVTKNTTIELYCC
jgi:hypothetical protein